MKFLVVCVLVAVSLRFMSSQSETQRPGFRVIFTTKGLQYAHQVGLSLLKEWVCDYTIPDFKISSEFGIALINYNFSNTTIHRLDFGKSSFTTDIGGLVVSDDRAAISFSTDWSIDEEDWPQFTDYGSATVSADGISISVTTDVVVNDTNGGHPVLNATDCSFSIDDIDVVFSGGSSYIYNMFGLAIDDFLKHELKKKTCSQVMTWINTLGNEYVESLPVAVNVTHDHKVEISYALVDDANFTHMGRIVTDHKGEFFVRANCKDPPFSPPPLPDPSSELFNETKMVHIIATTYVVESASYAFWKAGLMTYNISSDKLKPLNYDTTALWCKLVSQPELCKKFPGKKVMLFLNATEYPRLNITEGYASMSAKANASLYVDNDGTEELAFTLELSVTADAHPRLEYRDSVQYYYICGNVTNPKLTITAGDSNVGPIDYSKLEDIIKDIALPFAIRFINEYTEKGFPIPSMDGVSLHNITLKLGEGYFVFGSDVCYDKPNNMTCIYDP